MPAFHFCRRVSLFAPPRLFSCLGKRERERIKNSNVVQRVGGGGFRFSFFLSPPSFQSLLFLRALTHASLHNAIDFEQPRNWLWENSGHVQVCPVFSVLPKCHVCVSRVRPWLRFPVAGLREIHPDGTLPFLLCVRFLFLPGKGKSVSPFPFSLSPPLFFFLWPLTDTRTAVISIFTFFIAYFRFFKIFPVMVFMIVS